MIPSEILEKLICFSDEEIDLLNGKKEIDKNIFIDQTSNIVDYHKLLSHQEFAVRKHTRFTQYPKHRHNYLELVYVYGGQVTHIIDNEKIVIKEGELLLLNQNIEHEIAYTNENDIVFNFIIKPEFIDFVSTLNTQDSEVFDFVFNAIYSFDNEGQYLLFNVSNQDTIKNYVETMITRIYQPSLNNELELKLLLGLLLCELTNYPELIKSYTTSSYEKIISSTILKYISTHYKDGSLQHLSLLINQPNYYICKIIKRYTGQTFISLMQQERMKVVETMLINTNLPLIDIIHEVGYENESYFYRLFKKIYHMTPLEYRMQNKTV